MWTAKTVKRPPQQPAQPQHANYWAPLTRKRHMLPHPSQPRHTNHGAPRTRKRHQQEHRLQRPTERSDPTQHTNARMGDCPGPRKETTTRRNVTQGGRELKKVYVPKIGPKFPAPVINFVFPPQEIFLMWAGLSADAGQGPKRPVQGQGPGHYSDVGHTLHHKNTAPQRTPARPQCTTKS